MTDSIGMMEGAFFVSRNEILAWINELLKLEVEKIEQTCTGAVACQILDVIYPGAVSMHKVNWKAKQEYEYINNYKILQQVFLNKKISKFIEVEKLVKGKYQDNLEFMQWLKRYYDLNANHSATYDPVARRKGAALPASSATGKKTKAPKPSATAGPEAEPKIAVPKAATKPEDEKPAKKASPAKGKELEEAKKVAEGFKNERDFYFEKLRNIEILLNYHEKEKIPMGESIKKILYAGEEDEVSIDENGKVIITAEGDAGETPQAEKAPVEKIKEPAKAEPAKEKPQADSENLLKDSDLLAEDAKMDNK